MDASVLLIKALGGGWKISQLPTAAEIGKLEVKLSRIQLGTVEKRLKKKVGWILAAQTFSPLTAINEAVEV